HPLHARYSARRVAAHAAAHARAARRGLRRHDDLARLDAHVDRAPRANRAHRFRLNRPHAYSHIYPEVQVNGRWIACDATMPHGLGWAPPAIWKRTSEV